MEANRKILIKFPKEQDLSELSDKLFSMDHRQLLPNMREAHFSKNDGTISTDFEYKQTVRKKAKELKEWEYHWKDLTPFESEKKPDFASIVFYFSSDFDNKELTELFGQTITDRTKSIFYPKQEVQDVNLKRRIGSRGNPQYPIYIISKGRSKTNATADHLIKMNVPFRFVIEAAEHDDYAEVYGDNPLVQIIHRDETFKDEYDTYIDNFDDSKSKGSGPSRNFVWWHSKNVEKADWHWIMDDNIFGFCYYDEHQRIKAVDGTLFAAAEDFVNRYDNIGISGLNYYMFAVPGSKDRPYVSNTKIYSCLLINNNTSVRWAGRYNEDVDICIRALKEGYSTIQFDAFLAKKGATQTMGGGNTDAFYAEEGTLPKSNMLMHNHPDITKVTWRFQRWHHITNYDIFDYYKNRTIGETIQDMIKEPVLNFKEHAEIIEQIRTIDFSRIKRWNILENVDNALRDRIFDVLKFYRYKKNTEQIIELLTAPKILNCDYYKYIWHEEIEDTEDNKIMKDLLALGNDKGVLFNAVDWDKYLDYVQENKRNRIKNEMQRNKYLMKDYEKHEYNIQEVLLTQEDHLAHRDSKVDILNILNKTNDEAPLTLFDKKVRNEVKIQNKKVKSNLTSRGAKIVKEHTDYTLMIHGSSDFEDLDLFLSEMKNINPEVKEIINSVNYEVDIMSANYALDNKMKNKEFVPDEILNTTNAYKVIYKEMAEYADECILFVNSDSEDINFLINEFKSKNKPVKIVSTIQDSLDDW